MKRFETAITPWDGEAAQIALEELGVSKDEKEHVFYVYLNDFEQLAKAAAKEHQDQWDIKIPRTEDNVAGGSIRVRKTTHFDSPVGKATKTVYTQTTKVIVNDKGEKDEYEQEVGSDNFAQFMMLSPYGMVKDRFTFPIEGTDLKWEVDVYLKADGTYHNWCKIDLEVEDLNTPIPSELPIAVTNIILGNPKKNSDEDKVKIRELYDTVFLTRNRYRSVE